MKKLHVIGTRPDASAQGPETRPTTDAAQAPEFRGSQYWRSLASRNPAASDEPWREFKDGADALEIPSDGVSRRRFFGLVGSGAALAGLSATTTGCIRKPKENILPFNERPEDLIPGKPVYYATAFSVGDSVEGIVVESQDGRPTKVEGNPKHPNSLGATSALAQASVLDLYDPDRSRYAVVGGEKADLSAALAQFDAMMSGNGDGVALVLPYLLSPTERSLLADLRKRLPGVRVFLDDLLVPHAAFAAAEKIGGIGARFRYALTDAKVVFAADCNFLGGLEFDSVRLQREWARGRRMTSPEDTISRLYVVEPQLTNTGVMADHRMRVAGSKVGDALLVLARALGMNGLPKLPEGDVDDATRAMLEALARDLLSAGEGHSAILVGYRQPAWVHEVALAINNALGNTGRSVIWRHDATAPAMESLSALAEALRDGKIKGVVAVGTNPVYDGAGDLGLADLLASENVQLLHAGPYRDETGVRAVAHLPLSHDLEAWGDVVASDGTQTIRQPLIDPLHGTPSRTELLARLASGQEIDGYSLLKGQWMQYAGAEFSEQNWRKWLHEGVVPAQGAETRPTLSWASAGTGASSQPAIDGWEINLYLDPKVADGRFANNVWLQELPEAVTKMAWDNAALLSAASARELGVEQNDLLSVTVDGRTIEVPAFVAPGQAERTISIALGYGRKILPHHAGGEPAVATDGAGFSAYPLSSTAAPWFAPGTVQKTGRQYALVTTQDFGRLRPMTGNAAIDESDSSFGKFAERPIVLEATVEDYAKDPTFTTRANLTEPEQRQHLWNPPDMKGEHQWGMSIDLNTCTSCNACVIACQAENNIPVVGKEQISHGREMHWLRIDRYYRGDDDNPTAVLQPMFCQHCESAPCEAVCPVAATVHSPEGLNEMTYNRCIGTRYCSNNCPYKVRRFNFFNYNTNLRPTTFWNEDTDGAWLRQMQKNPDVTIRFRGVMEKCTYCVQRINQAKIAAKVSGKDRLPDGAIVTACQQVCPTETIVFGNVADPNSKVSIAKRSTRDYAVLADLNTHPRTSYLARIRNSNPALPRPIPEPPLVKHHAGEEAHGGEAHGAAHHGDEHGVH